MTDSPNDLIAPNAVGAPELKEIEITPEMVEAGEGILLAELGGAVTSVFWHPRDLAKQVYLAMFRSHCVGN